MKQKKLLPFIVAGVVVAATAVVIVVINIIAANSFSAVGQRALECVDDLRDMARVPRSFSLYSDVLYLDTTDDGEYLGREYIYIDYTAENSYGAALRGAAVFIDGEYYDREHTGPSREDYDMSDKTQVEEYMAELSESIKVSQARFALLEWGLLRKLGIDSNENIESFEVIPADKIAAKLGLRAE